MNRPSTSPKSTNYGIDAPNVVRGLFLAGMILFVPDTASFLLLKKGFPHGYDKTGRDTAVREIVRVLEPGGRLAIIDIRHTMEYAQVLWEDRKMDVKRAGPNFLFVIPTFTLTATKP